MTHAPDDDYRPMPPKRIFRMTVNVRMVEEQDEPHPEFSAPLGRPMTHEQLAAAFRRHYRPVEPDPDDWVPLPDDVW